MSPRSTRRALAALLLTLSIARPLTGHAQDDAGVPSDAAVDGGGEVAAPALVEGAAEQVDTLTMVHVGVYVMRISDFSQRDGRFDIDAWFWFRWQGTDVMPHEAFEIVNGNITEREANDVIDDGGFNYAAVRVQATIYHPFDVTHFPFDDHVITIEVEDSNLENANQQFVVDQGIALDEVVQVEGWQVRLGRPTAAPHEYPTTYGYRSLDSTTSSYSRFIVPIHLERHNLMALFKLFWVSYLSVILGLLAFRVRATDLDARFGLGTGSIFAASANAFVVADQLPQTSSLTLAEQVNLLAVGCIFISVFISVASLRLCYKGKEEASEKLDRFALFGLGTIYLVLNAVVIARGLH